MTATSTAPAPAAPTAAAAHPLAAAPMTPTRSTPQLLQRLSTAVVVFGVLLGVVGALTLATLAYTLHRAEQDTAQLVRVQNIETDLLSADAAATNAFLVGGLEPAAQRTGYDRAITETGELIAEAARAQPADAAALAVLNTQVLDYTAAIEQARANNRQGLPVGAQYLRLASAQLRSSALPVLDELVAANAARAEQRMSVAWGVVFPVLTLAALVGLVLAQRWLSRRFHRRINSGMAAATVVLLVTLLTSLVGLWYSHSIVSSTREGSYAGVNNIAAARIAAYDAKANESLTLIARGSGQSFEAAWVSSDVTVRERLGLLTRVRDDGQLAREWAQYTAVHQSIRTSDDGGSWDAAVAKATGTGDTSSNLRFTTFDASLASVLDDATRSTSTSLGGQTPLLVVAAVLSLLAGLAAALLARRGVAARLREYR